MSKINFDQPSTGNVNSSADALAVANKGSGNAITGNANQGTGILGTSGGSDGVLGQSSSKAHAGVSAINDSGGFGLWARGTPAVVGTSANGEGVHGESQEVRIDEEGNYARLNDGVFGVGRN